MPVVTTTASASAGQFKVLPSNPGRETVALRSVNDSVPMSPPLSQFRSSRM